MNKNIPLFLRNKSLYKKPRKTKKRIEEKIFQKIVFRKSHSAEIFDLLRELNPRTPVSLDHVARKDFNLFLAILKFIGKKWGGKA